MRMYQQSIPLPSDANEGSMSAEYKDNKLVISVKKRKKSTQVQPSIDIKHLKENTSKEEKKEDVNISKESNTTENNISKKMTITSDLPSMS